MRAMVEVDKITKNFAIEKSLLKHILRPLEVREEVCALREVCFSVGEGEILGLVGPNGAGKTTLIRIIADLVKPDSGKVRISGCPLSDSSGWIRSKIGYVSSDERNFFWRLTGNANLEFFGHLYGLSLSDVRERSSRLLKIMGLETKADKLFQGYSAGMRKKLAIIRAMLHRPSVVLLDEVTNSLDTDSAAKVKAFVREYVIKEKRTAIWSTHRLEEIRELCDRVIKIEDGRVVFDGRTSELFQKNKNETSYVLEVSNMNGCFTEFNRICSQNCDVQSFRSGEISEFYFTGISAEKFSYYVTMAVRDYGAYIVYAGCIEKRRMI